MKTLVHLWQDIAEFFVEWESFLDRICKRNQNTNFVFSNLFSENRAAFEVTWKNDGEPNRPQMAI
jgi:hypothetical protein